MWGLVNRYSAEATAEMYNAKGGVKIGAETYKIKIVSIDDKADAKAAAAGAGKLTGDGVKYIIGPNVDATAVPGLSIDNPFLKEKTPLKYVGKKYFSQQRQIGVQVVVTEYRNGALQTLFVGEIAD